MSQLTEIAMLIKQKALSLAKQESLMAMSLSAGTMTGNYIIQVMYLL